MYGSEHFRSWLLMPSGPDNVLFFSLDMNLPSSQTEIYGTTNGSHPEAEAAAATTITTIITY